MIGDFIKRGNMDRDTDTYMGEHHVNMKAEIRMMYLQAKECSRLPTKHQRLGKGMRQVLGHKP